MTDSKERCLMVGARWGPGLEMNVRRGELLTPNMGRKKRYKDGKVGGVVVNPYYGNEVQGAQLPGVEPLQQTCSDVVESQDGIIELPEKRLDAEKLGQERLLRAVSKSCHADQTRRAPAPHTTGCPNLYDMEGFQG